MADTPEEVLGMSDEDFLKLNDPAAEAVVDEPSAPAVPDNTSSADQASGDGGTSEESGAAGSTEAGATETGAGANTETTTTETTTTTEGQVAGGESTADTKTGETAAETGSELAKTEGEAPKDPEPIDYKAGFELIMKPFKANGKMIEPKSPEEAVALMQMGANYTRKMQELQPHRKTLLMLQNNGLLDPDKLSFLIDLDKGNPEAVKKFIKDRGIDPLDIDTSTDPAYLGGNHQVTDQEVNFRSALEELSSTSAGKETLQDINDRWDNVSKEALWQHPQILTAIQEQRESGVYATIVAEVDRQITLGKLPASTPFLEAYQTVGDQLVAEHNAKTGQGNVAPKLEPEAPQVLATRAATPKSPITNSDKAAAASPSRGNATPPKTEINPLAMSDDDFLKQWNGRL